MASFATTHRSLRIFTVANVPPDPNSGAAGTVYHTNLALRELGHHVDEIWQEDLGKRLVSHGNLHALLEQPRRYRNAILNATKKYSYDVVLISQPQGFLAAKTLKKQGFKGVVVNRSHGLELRVNAVLPGWHKRLGVPESRLPSITRILRRYLDRQWNAAVESFDGIVLPSSDDLEFLKRQFSDVGTAMTMIHHGIPDSFLQTSPPPMTKQRQKRLLFIGQHSFIKGPDILVRVANKVLQEDPQLTLTWVTNESAHRNLHCQLRPEIQPRVSLRPWIAQHELLPLLDSHGVFVFPSLFEGAGKACSEALARGLGVVASDTGAMRDHLRQIAPNWLCPVGDVAAISEKIRWMTGNNAPIDRDREAAILYCRSLTWKSCAQQLVRFFAHCAARKHDAAKKRLSSDVPLRPHFRQTESGLLISS
ncbi:glycosyltransferase family 4 protein [Stieleria sp. JC731]|uniref:glycosyltransferase family 4 protein n=1 Tax=Pirellulaceae TaxID=2691357 RepID=UPI001E4EA9FC|nr:glycosyltransferase family 4 protein [Stieleria sp. JC731]MCC9601226.1 glycosyltransferase family 4 protein [Stieleria sp. JC731]